jgi:hypothetical protein
MPQGTYVVQGGESWESIAGKMYGDQRMFAELMKANSGVLMLHPGMTIVLPNQVENPFVSNELAAAMGMATTGQLKSLYGQGLSGRNFTGGGANQAWAGAWARGRGQVPGLDEYGNLPSSFNVGGGVGGGTTVAPAAVGGRADAEGPNWSNVTRPGQVPLAPTPRPPSRGNRGDSRNQGGARVNQSSNPGNVSSGNATWLVANGYTWNGTAYVKTADKPMTQWEKVFGEDPNVSLFGVKMLGGNNARRAWNSLYAPDTGIFGFKTSETPSAASGTAAQPISDPVAAQVAADQAQQAIAQEYVANYEGIDWLSVQAGLNVPPPYGYKYESAGFSYYTYRSSPSPYYQDPGQFGLINLRLSSG